MTKYIFLKDEDIEKIKNGEEIKIDEDYTGFGMKKTTMLLHENQYKKFKTSAINGISSK